MKRVTQLILASILFISGMTLTSCSDGYSLDNYIVVVGTVVTTDNSSYYIEEDDGTKLWVAATMDYYHPQNGKRVIANVTLLSDKKGEFDHYIRVNSISHILTKETIQLTEANQDSIGNDRVKVLDIWYGGGYLNFIFGANVGGYANHFINLVENTLVTPPNDGKVHLEFRHNANEDPEYRAQQFIVSFNIDKFLNEGEGGVKTFVIKANTFGEGEKEFTIEINPTKTKVDLGNEEIFVASNEWE